jgi:hypothetical protein
MSDNTAQGGNDTIHTDEIINLNGVTVSDGAKAQRVKVGFGADGFLKDVHDGQGLPTGAAYLDVPLVANQTTFTNAVNGTAIDTLGFNWAAIQMSAGYTGMTALTIQGSNDNTNWITLAVTPVGATGTGLSTALGIAAAIWHGPIPTRYIRFVPVGAGSGLTLTLNIRLLGEAMVLNSQGVNAGGTITTGGFSTGVANAISNAAMTVGVGTGNSFQARVTGTIDQAAAAIAGVAQASVFAYVTEIHCSTWGAAAGAAPTPRRFQLLAAASALGEHNLVCPPNETVERMFRNPWKIASAVNIALNLAVTSMIAANAGNWEIVLHGYYNSA